MKDGEGKQDAMVVSSPANVESIFLCAYFWYKKRRTKRTGTWFMIFSYEVVVVKWQCHKISWHFYQFIEPNVAPDKRAKMDLLDHSFSRTHSRNKWRWADLHCAEPNFANKKKSNISARKRIFQQNHFSQLIKGPGGFDSLKNCQQISWHCCFKIWFCL